MENLGKSKAPPLAGLLRPQSNTKFKLAVSRCPHFGHSSATRSHQPGTTIGGVSIISVSPPQPGCWQTNRNGRQSCFQTLKRNFASAPSAILCTSVLTSISLHLSLENAKPRNKKVSVTGCHIAAPKESDLGPVVLRNCLSTILPFRLGSTPSRDGFRLCWLYYSETY